MHPRLAHHPPRSWSSRCLLVTGIHSRPIRRQAPTGSPLPQALDLVASSDSHGHDVLRGLNERDIEQRSEPAARLDLGADPVGVIRPGPPTDLLPRRLRRQVQLEKRPHQSPPAASGQVIVLRRRHVESMHDCPSTT